MNKLILTIGCSLLCLQLLAQPRIECFIQPAFDAPATIRIQTKAADRLELIFNQTGEQRPTGSFSWGEDTTKLVNVRRIGRYFQRFAFSDTINVTSQEAPFLFKAYQEVFSQAKALASSKDDRLLLDGLTCKMTVLTDSHTSYEIKYSTPAYEGNQLANQFLKAVLMSVKMKSKNPATVNYCMIADVYMH